MVILPACAIVAASAQGAEKVKESLAESACQIPRSAGGREIEVYKWRDADGAIHFAGRMPPAFAGPSGACPNNPGDAVEQCESKKTEERRAQAGQQSATAQGSQSSADQILLRTYLQSSEDGSNDDLGVDGCQGQRRVIQWHIRNLQHQLACLEAKLNTTEADESLLQEIRATKAAMERQLRKLGDDEAFQDWCQDDLRHYRDIPEQDRYEVEPYRTAHS